MAFPGVWFDTVTMTVQITPDRLSQLKEELGDWASKHRASKKQVQSLLGKLNFVAKCVRPGRLFMSRMLDWLRTLTDNKPKLIPLSFKQDINWWCRFIDIFNGTRKVPPTIWGPHDSCLATDACLSGIGGVCLGGFFHFKIPNSMTGYTINELEATAVMVALKLWACKMSGKRCSIRCDNTTTVLAINNLKTRNTNLQNTVREIMFLCATYEIEIRAIHIPGLENRIPDWLSRWHLDSKFQKKFRQWNLVNRFSQRTVTDTMLQFSHNW